ncbi:peptidase M24, structural domain-containing protein [Rhizoctonia solani]|nr:peptidase M24, structural domain-containing protein [Rhizoctonia solani]
MSPPPPPQIPAALQNLCGQIPLPGVKRSNTTSSKHTYQSKSSMSSRPTYRTQESFDSHNSEKVGFDDPMGYPAKGGYYKATNVDGVIKFTAVDEDGKAIRTPELDAGYKRTDTAGRLSELRKLMRNEKIDYYIIPSEDAHQSEYVAASDRRREYISGFTGSAGTAIVSLNNAYLFTDSRYYIQAEREIDRNWTLFKVGSGEVKPWNEWILNRSRGAAIGIDSRLIAHDTATALTSALKLKGMRMAYPQRNLIDQIWKDRPSKSAAPIYLQDIRYAGEHSASKLDRLRIWLKEYPVPAADLKYSTPARSSSPASKERPTSKPLPDLPPSRTPSRQNSMRKDSLSRQNSTSSGPHPPTRTPSRSGLSRKNSTASRDNIHRDRGETAVRLIPHYSTFISNLSCIAWLLNLRGGDIPCNPLFHAYLLVGVDKATLFVDARKLSDEVKRYLRELRISIKEVSEVWGYLRKREFGSGKVIIPPKTPYAVSLMLTYSNYMVAPSWVESNKAIKNKVEIQGFRNAYLRDGVAMTKWFAWLEEQLRAGNTITEWEAAEMLTQFRKQGDLFMGLAYENISATGANAALPHYSPTKGLSSAIDLNTPYLNDSGGQYKDGTCDTTRTVHFGHPTDEQCEAFTRVLKGHIAIDSAIFPQGTTGKQLDVLARHALWKDGLNYLHGTGHGFGSFLSVHEGPHGFGIDVPLEVGHVITNEPGFYREGLFGVRIESALVVKRVETKGQFGGDIWLGFERFTCVPIQTRMVKMELLTKDERRWLKEHNRKCKDLLAPLLEDDSRALRWIRRESTRTSPQQTSAGVTIDWD